jgi:hypothetical protein
MFEDAVLILSRPDLCKATFSAGRVVFGADSQGMLLNSMHCFCIQGGLHDALCLFHTDTSLTAQCTR